MEQEPFQANSHSKKFVTIFGIVSVAISLFYIWSVRTVTSQEALGFGFLSYGPISIVFLALFFNNFGKDLKQNGWNMYASLWALVVLLSFAAIGPAHLIPIDYNENVLQNYELIEGVTKAQNSEYTYDKQGISVTLPSDWNVIEGGGGSTVLIVSPLSIEKLKSYLLRNYSFFGLEMSSNFTHSGPTDPTEFIFSLKNSYPAGYAKEKVETGRRNTYFEYKDAVVINGIEYPYFIEYLRKTKSVWQVLYYFARGDEVYYTTCRLSAENNVTEERCNNIMESVKF